MALLTTGLTTGLVIDVGNLETSVLPVMTKRLTELLYDHGRFIPPSNLHLSLAPHNNIPSNLLTPEVLEDIKTRVIFCSPVMIGQQQGLTLLESYKKFSSATDLYYPITLKDGTRANLLIPGWIREKAAEVLFEGDEDEPSIAQCILDSLLKLPPDLRKPAISSLLFIGGTSLLPGFQSRVKEELLRIMKDPVDFEKRRYGPLLRLHKSIKFIDNPEDKGAGRIFMNNVRGWIGGSLVGSLKLSGEEITKEKFSGSVTDWSIGNWSNPLDTLDRELGNVGSK
ncbi:uncharacterized protein EV154DRAFT_538884 [Mucor mucedo]|uniref:uncharacterized protein n=1 Tax=Mucor mucedo TaxID=29922 RepID=UPI00221FE648|nr:uncharacterized protein EV154DRAFT_538884 [Mucor mucedo]KAI7889452.1 hypothetical protein EV154DRAFT_538884 [Mucor mucedo]